MEHFHPKSDENELFLKKIHCRSAGAIIDRPRWNWPKPNGKQTQNAGNKAYLKRLVFYKHCICPHKCKNTALLFRAIPHSLHIPIWLLYISMLLPHFIFALWIKFWSTKQQIITFIATTLKALLSVAKTNGRLARRKLYTCNIHHFFRNILFHISPISI